MSFLNQNQTATASVFLLHRFNIKTILSATRLLSQRDGAMEISIYYLLFIYLLLIISDVLPLSLSAVTVLHMEPICRDYVI